MQCTGLVDAPYLGSGVQQPCAWNHPFWAIETTGAAPSWRLQGGDTLVIHPGSYMMGYGAPNTEWCFAEGAYDCVLPPLPSGPDPDHPTRIVGYGWDAGCLEKPELWGTERAWQIFDLSGAQNVLLACLELTDHASCAYAHANPEARCNYDQAPFGPWAYRGLLIKDASHITLRDLDIHGFGSEGIMAGRVNGLVAERIRLAGNGWCGWNGDLWGEESSNEGDLIFEGLVVEWNGCVESYPGGEPDHCWAQSQGGYGDGFGVARSGGHWVFRDSIFRYNTSDGLDLLYVGVQHQGSFIGLYNVRAYGNAGNQLKVGGRVEMLNILAVSNCNFFTGKPFAQEMGDYSQGDACRAGGAAISVSMNPQDQSYIINSTLASEGWAQVEVYCHTRDFPEAEPCTGSERLYLMNNVFVGFPNITSPGDWPDLVGDGDPEGRTRPDTIDYNLIFNTETEEVALAVGSNNIFADPRLVSYADIDDFDGHLQGTSPAIDAGLPVGALSGRVPAEDLEHHYRPQGSGVDLGAYEYGAGGPEMRVDIKVNGSDGPLSLARNDQIHISVSLTTTARRKYGDYFLWAEIPSGTCYCYAYPEHWVPCSCTTPLPAYQGALVYFSNLFLPPVINCAELPKGPYRLIFVVDQKRDGIINPRATRDEVAFAIK